MYDRSQEKTTSLHNSWEDLFFFFFGSRSYDIRYLIQISSNPENLIAAFIDLMSLTNDR